MLSAQTIATIKATLPALEAHGETLTKHFYRRMFNGNPEVRAFFNPAHQHAGTAETLEHLCRIGLVARLSQRQRETEIPAHGWRQRDQILVAARNPFKWAFVLAHGNFIPEKI